MIPHTVLCKVIIRENGGRAVMKTIFRSSALIALLFFALSMSIWGGSASASESVTLAYGSADASQLQWFYAQDKGYFKKYGLDSSLIYFDSGAKGVQALLAGSVDFLAGDGHALINARLAGADVLIIGLDLGVLPGQIVAAKGIKSAQDVKGKRYAISSFGSESQLSESLFLKHFKISDADITTVQLGNQSNRYAGLESGQVAATSLEPPVSSKAEAAGYPALINLSELAPDYLSVAVATQASTIRQRPKVVKAILEALADATAALKKDRAGSVAVIKRYLKSSDTDALASWTYFAPLFKTDLRPSAQSIQFLLDHSTDPAAKTMKPGDFMDLTILDEIDREGFFKSLK
jgi:NitT/TauT family transport system substrate-binding protein